TSTLDGRPGVAVEVVDHGPGLAPEQAERVFERFYGADPARSPADGGSGLGLSIVAALVAVHGGTVAVDRVPGRGARFRVVLPLAPDAAGGPHSNLAAAAHLASRGRAEHRGMQALPQELPT